MRINFTSYICHPVLRRRQNFLPTAYVVRREGYVLTRVCPSVHTWGGGTQPGPGPGRGVPCWGGGTQPGLNGSGDTWPGPDWGGTWTGPDWGGGTWTGPDEGGVPRPGPDGGGYPGRTTEGVLATRRSVCLLHSRRRTFLFHLFLLLPGRRSM